MICSSPYLLLQISVTDVLRQTEVLAQNSYFYYTPLIHV
jgi:hypothetical protein